MRPEDDAPRDEPEGLGESGQDAGEPDVPPSTYAGRKRAKGESEPGDEAGEHGLTDEFDQIERELDAELDGLGDDHLDEEDESDEPEPEEEEGATEPEEEAAAAEAEAGAEKDEVGKPEDEDEQAESEEEPEPEEPKAEPGETVEAETVALADREAAQEAALAGLKARAGDGKTWEGAAPAVEEKPAEDSEETAQTPPLWPRFLTASLVIIISMTVATSVSALVYLDHWGKRLGDNGRLDRLKGQLSEVDGGAPQNILILGSDERLDLPGDRRSDTAILLRVDPDQQAISLLSIPRDLKVSIPKHGIDKFNAAYSIGGPKLTLETVENLTGVELHHVVNINFTGFADAVNAIDCVYIDVDRKYYIPPESGIAEIDVDAGYQRMCGFKALQFVRYRHDDNDLIRAARQQDFLREARQKVPPWKLIEDRNDLLTIFTDYTTSDISDGVELLELLKTFLAARNAHLQEVHFPADLGDGTSIYVTASQQAIKDTVDTFLGTKGTPGPPEAGESSRAARAEAERKGGGKKGGGKGDGKDEKEESDGPPMDDATAQGQEFARQFADAETKGGERMIRFPIFYPTQLVPGSIITNASRAFPIDGPGSDKYWGYKMSVQVPGQSFGNGLLQEYYGISGTNWTDPPILENPSESREIDGRSYDLYYDGDRLRLVAWHDKRDNSYWVNNSLSQSLSEAQMLAIAVSMRRDD